MTLNYLFINLKYVIDATKKYHDHSSHCYSRFLKTPQEAPLLRRIATQVATTENRVKIITMNTHRLSIQNIIHGIDL